MGRTNLLIGAGLLAALSAPRTDAAEITHAVNIPGQPLGPALQQLARQSGTQIVFFSRLTDGLTTSGIEGDYTLDEAMRRLLQGNGLTFREVSDKTVEVRRLPRETRVAAGDSAVSPEPMEEIVVRGTVEQLAVTRVATPLRELPQTVTVLTQDMLRTLDVTDLAGALNQAPGITMVQQSTLHQQFFSRGFEVTTFHVDGGTAVSPYVMTPDPLLAPRPNVGLPDLSEYERVEVLRGSDALFGALGNPGGTVSLVRKRARDEFAFDSSVQLGSWEQRRVALDLTGPLAGDGALRGRAIGTWASQDYFYDDASKDLWKLFGEIEYDFTRNATLTAGGSSEHTDLKPFLAGFPLRFDGTNPGFPRSKSQVFAWNRVVTDVSQAFAQYRQRFGDSWTLRINAASWRARSDYAVGYFSFALDPATSRYYDFDAGQAEVSSRPEDNRQRSADLTLTGTFDLFGLRTDLAFGGDYSKLRLEFNKDSYGNLGPGGADPLDFDRALYPDPRGVVEPYNSFEQWFELESHGVYASFRLHFNDAVSTIVGARLNDHELARGGVLHDDFLGDTEIHESSGDSHVPTPFFGLVVDTGAHLSWYGSYAQTYMGELVPTFSFEDVGFGIVRGTNIEAGVKGEWRDGALRASLAAYKIKQSNIPIDDPDEPLAYLRSDRQSHGIDMELQGQLAPGWQIGGGYTWNVNENEDRRPLSRSTPRHLLKLWTTKRLSVAGGRWTLGGNVHAQSAITDSDEAICIPELERLGYCEVTTISQSAYAVVDVHGSFDLDRNWTLALSVNNLFDENYGQTMSNLFHTWYGEPRNFMLRIDSHF